jgi:hypothetical protein
MTVLLWRTICDHLRRARLGKILNVFQRIRLRFFPSLRPRIWPHLLRLVTKAMSGRLLSPHYPCTLLLQSPIPLFLRVKRRS